MTKLAHRFLKDQRGATGIEYALIAGFLSIIIVGAVSGLGSNLKAKFTVTPVTALVGEKSSVSVPPELASLISSGVLVRSVSALIT